jgi:two-component system, sensor histidine kinase RegB
MMPGGVVSKKYAPESGNAAQAALPWVVRLRYGMVAGETAIVLGTFYGFRLDFPLLWTLAALTTVFASNIWLGQTRDFSARYPDETLGAVFVLDTLCLTAMLGLTGGPNNPFSLLYLVQIALSAVALRKSWTRALGALATACFGLLFFFHIPLAALQTHNSDNRLSPHLVGMWVAFVVGVALITFFTGKISDALRRREREVFQLQEQVAKHERLASLVTLAAGAAHELGTPLGTIAVVAKELERYASVLAGNGAARAGSDAVLEDARLIRSEVERCRKILERMSVQGAEPMGETARHIRIADLLHQVVDQLPEAQRTMVVIEVSNERLTAVLPAQATAQSIAALLQNAIDANRERRAVIVRAAEIGPELSVSIRDEGHGMPETVLRRIAEPFFTTKEPGKGMGLGTFLVRTFAERLGGRLSFESIAGQGTVATLLLPLGQAREDAHGAL